MIKQIDDNLYQVISKWWIAQSWQVMPKDALSQRGYIVYENEKPIVAGFLYKDETSSLGMIGWIISNPETTHDERDKALDKLILHIEAIAKVIGVKLLLTFMKHENLIKKLIQHSYITLGDGSIEMAKIIKKEI